MRPDAHPGDHRQAFRNWTRLPVLGHDEHITLAIALEPDEALYGLGEKFGADRSPGLALSLLRRGCARGQHRVAYKNIPFVWSSRHWGVFFHTPCLVTHGLGDPDWSHRSYAAVVERRTSTCSCWPATGRRHDRHYHFLTGRPPVPRWGLGAWYSKAYYRTFDEALRPPAKRSAR